MFWCYSQGLSVCPAFTSQKFSTSPQPTSRASASSPEQARLQMLAQLAMRCSWKRRSDHVQETVGRSRGEPPALLAQPAVYWSVSVCTGGQLRVHGSRVDGRPNDTTDCNRRPKQAEPVALLASSVPSLMHLLSGARGCRTERRLGAVGRHRADQPILHVDKVAHRVEMQIEQLELISLRQRLQSLAFELAQLFAGYGHETA